SVMAFVMVTAPNPAGSKASISPPGAVLEMAPAQVLHGAVRLQGLTSSPTPETQVRLACPYIMAAVNTTNAKRLSDFLICSFKLLFFAIKCEALSKEPFVPISEGERSWGRDLLC